MKLPDYHVHTAFCGHADGEIADYVARARSLGLPEMGFADHLPLLHVYDPTLTMAESQLATYVSAVIDLRTRHADLGVLLGIEVDYLDEATYRAHGLEDGPARVRDLLARHPFDYVLGSVHFLGDFMFDHPDHRDEWERRDVAAVYREYYGRVADAAASGLFTVMAHLDLPKKLGQRPDGDVTADEDAALDALAASGVALEVNTSGWRMPVAEAYPAPDLLARAQQRDIRLVFGSDAHSPGDVGADFDRALDLARGAGYASFLRLSDGAEVSLP